jgi:hypothetical protein
MKLSHDLRFEDLYLRDGLERVDAAFLGFLAEADGPLRERLVAARAAPETLDARSEADRDRRRSRGLRH